MTAPAMTVTPSFPYGSAKTRRTVIVSPATPKRSFIFMTELVSIANNEVPGRCGGE